jgi:hypothetical protein
MKFEAILKAVFGAILLAAAGGLIAADTYKVANGPKDFYFGHISYIEPTPGGTDPVVLREGGAEPEPGILNLPVGPGDTIRTSGDRRCEIQFDTGTIIRLDVATEVRVETILARSLSSSNKLSVLTLGKGRIYVMYKEYDRGEMFQVLTPNAAVKMKPNAVAVLTAASDGTTEAQVDNGRVQVLFGPDEKKLDDRAVKKGERLIVLADHQTELAAAIQGTAFELWNQEVNAHFDDLHAGLTALPKPIQKLPGAVFYFAQTYGNHYGEWIWDEMYGYVWRPYIDNGAYPWGWSPYYYGSWSYSGGQLFWVPQEPWGWIPYHLGVWQWDKKLGWVWLPGSMFAPAWADWDFFFGYASWRPWSLFDWMYDNPYWASDFGYLGDELIYAPYWSGEPGPAPKLYRTVVTKDALKQPSTGSLPIPSELKAVVKKVTSAYEKGDARIREGAAAVPRQLVIVAKGDLTSRAINEKALTLDQVAKRGGVPSGPTKGAPPRVADPRREAVRIFRGIDGPAAAPRRLAAPDMTPIRSGNMTAVPVGPAGRADRPGTPSGRAAPSPARFRDWNPDLRIARELGVHIEYSSRQNEVRCPELNLSSRDRERPAAQAPRLTRGGVGYGPSGFIDGQTAGGSSSSGSTAAPSPSTSTRGASERSSTATGPKESKGGGESGKIKN